MTNTIQRLRAALKAFKSKAPAVFETTPYFDLQGILGSNGSAQKQLEGYRGWVFGAVRIISNTAAAGRLRFYMENKNTSKTYLQKGHPLVELFKSPNLAMTRWYLWSLTFTYLELTGSAYWLKVRNRLGQVAMIFPLQPNVIKVVPDSSEIIKGFIFDNGMKKIALAKEDIVYLRYPHPTEIWNGMGPLEAAAYSYDADLMMHKYDKNLFNSGGAIKGALTTDQFLGADDAKKLRDDWKRLYSGPENAGAVAVLHSGLDYKAVQLNPQQLDFPALRRLSRQEIFALFGVSEGLLGMVEDVNKTNNVQLMDSFLRFTMQPKAHMIQEQIDKDLTNEFDERIETEFELPRAEDAFEEHRKMEIRLKNKVTIVNEERERLGYEPADWGKKPFISFSDVQWGDKPQEPGNGKAASGLRLLKIYELSDDEKDMLWQRFLQIHTPQENRFKRTMLDVFGQQRDEVISNLDKELRAEADPAIIEAILFDLEEWNPKLGTTLKPEFMAALKIAFAASLKDLGKSGQIDFTSPLVQEFLNNKKFILPEQINRLTHDSLREILKQGFADNLSVDEIAASIDSYFDSSSPARSIRIARTEMTGATNFGIHESFTQTGLVSKKSWLSARDERTRIAHLRAEQRTINNPIPIEEKFQVGADMLMYPGDASGRVGNIVNCRCTILASETSDE